MADREEFKMEPGPFGGVVVTMTMVGTVERCPAYTAGASVDRDVELLNRKIIEEWETALRSPVRRCSCGYPHDEGCPNA